MLDILGGILGGGDKEAAQSAPAPAAQVQSKRPKDTQKQPAVADTVNTVGSTSEPGSVNEGGGGDPMKGYDMVQDVGGGSAPMASPQIMNDDGNAWRTYRQDNPAGSTLAGVVKIFGIF